MVCKSYAKVGQMKKLFSISHTTSNWWHLSAIVLFVSRVSHNTHPMTRLQSTEQFVIPNTMNITNKYFFYYNKIKPKSLDCLSFYYNFDLENAIKLVCFESDLLEKILFWKAINLDLRRIFSCIRSLSSYKKLNPLTVISKYM
jgi:hypothetical protein